MKIPLLCFWSLCQVFTCLKYSVPMSTFTRTMEMAHMRDILILALSHPPEPHVWPNLEAQFTRLIKMHCLAFFNLLTKTYVSQMQYLEQLFQLIKSHNMHYRYEWLQFASRLRSDDIINDELRQMLNNTRLVIMNDHSDVYKITACIFNNDLAAFANTGAFNVEDIKTLSGLIKLSVFQFNYDIMENFNFLELLSSTQSRLSRNVVIKFIIQTLILLNDESIGYEKIMSVGSSLIRICGEECNDLKFLFDKIDSDSLKSAAVELVGKILSADNPSVDEVILCVILSLHIEDIPENLKSSIAQKSREISEEMSDWEWLALAGIVVKTSPPALVKADLSVFDTSKQKRCQMYLGATDMIYARLRKLPPISTNFISAFSCLPMEQYRNFHLQNLSFPVFLPSTNALSPNSLSVYVSLLNTTFYWEILNNEEIFRLMERLTFEALEKSSYLIVFPEDNGKYSVTLRNLREHEVESPEEFFSRKEVNDDMDLIVEIGLMQFYLQDKAVYRLEPPHLLNVSPKVYKVHNLIWKELFSRSNLLSILLSNQS